MAHQKINIAELTETLPIIYGAKVIQPLIITGMTGGGKTLFAKTVLRTAVAESLGLMPDDIGFVTERLASRDACEVAGVALPFKDEQGNLTTQNTKPPLITTIERTGKAHGVLLLDEILQANNDMQKVLGDTLDPSEHSIGGWPLPSGWVVVGTGNRTKDKSGANRLLAHLLDRVLMFELEFCITAWSEWAYANDVHPLIVECAIANSVGDISFFADSVPATDEQYCSPRSAVRASDHLTAFLNAKGQDAYLNRTIRSLLSANIGNGATEMLCTYAQVRDNVPTERDIQINPESCTLPLDSGYQMLAGHNAIASATDGDSIGQSFKYILRLRTDLQVSLGVRLLKIAGKNGWVSNEPLVNQFLAKYHDLITLGVS